MRAAAEVELPVFLWKAGVGDAEMGKERVQPPQLKWKLPGTTFAAFPPSFLEANRRIDGVRTSGPVLYWVQLSSKVTFDFDTETTTFYQ